MTDTATLTFGTADVPTVGSGRPSEPNPFDGHFPTPRDDAGKPTQALTVTLPGDAEKNVEQVRKLTNQARNQAQRQELTARVKVDETKNGKQTVTILTIWTVDRIKREKKAEAEAETASA